MYPELTKLDGKKTNTQWKNGQKTWMQIADK